MAVYPSSPPSFSPLYYVFPLVSRVVYSLVPVVLLPPIELLAPDGTVPLVPLLHVVAYFHASDGRWEFLAYQVFPAAG